MKNIKTLLAFLVLLTVSTTINAQEKTPEEMKKIVESQNYVFVAQWANPQGGRNRQLTTTDYDFTVTRDTIISYLPYFGRAYSAPYGSSEGGIKFTSTDFEYKPTTKKKSWEIAIKPKDVTEVQQLYLEIFNNGHATLRVTSTNKQGISFDGYVKEGKERAKKAF